MNKGFNPVLERKAQDGSEFLFGGFSQPCIASIPENEREACLPKGERQDIGEEKMWCASASPLNALEVKFNWLLKNKKILPQNEMWLREQGYITENGFEFSDAFTAILSGTTREGNSLKAPLQSIHSDGLIPKSKLPQLPSFDDNYNPNRITKQMEVLGMQFLSRFKINYEKVSELHYIDLLKDDMLGVALYAWPSPIDGEYPKTDLNPNHAVLVFRNQYYAFDNYTENNDPNDFIKKLASDFNFLDYGYRIFISAQYIPSNDSRFGAIGKLISDFLQWFLSIKEKADVVAPIITNPPTVETNTEKLLKVSLNGLDKDVSPQDLAKDELGCAESLSNLIKKVLPDFPIILSTKDLDTKLFMDKRFKRITEPKRGAIVISPRTKTTNGHCGIWITDERIASNDSKTGKFVGNYTWNSWIKEFKERRKLSIYIYELI